MAMSNWPLFPVILNLEGFDLAAFLLSTVVAIFSVGFAVDYILGRQGMGPVVEFFLRNAWRLRGTLRATIGGFDPMASMSLI